MEITDLTEAEVEALRRMPFECYCWSFYRLVSLGYAEAIEIDSGPNEPRAYRLSPTPTGRALVERLEGER